MNRKSIANCYNKHDPDKHYEEIFFRDPRPAMGSEHNELQSILRHRISGIANALFKDGDIIRDAHIVVDVKTGEVRASAGTIYLDGAVRDVAAKTFHISTEGSVAVGIRLIENVISELEDPDLYNPAVGTATHGLAGAWRLQVLSEWGFEGDGGKGNFYVVHIVDDGLVRHKEAPPNFDSFNQGIARYDRDSTGGGSYIVDGLVLRFAESTDNTQAYTITEGRARVHGHGVELPTSRRLSYPATPDVRLVEDIHIATGETNQRLNVAHSPIHSIVSLRVTLQKTISMLHGSYVGVADLLPDTSIVEIVECKQGETVYAAHDDYIKTGDRVDWSPKGAESAEPAPGSTYECTYRYMSAVEAKAQDFDGFSIATAVAGSSILLNYRHALPRLDRLCLTQEGTFLWRKGIASIVNPKLPDTPEDVLPIATVYQTWRDESLVQNDGIRVTSFAEIEAVNNRLDYVLREVVRNRLESSISAREAGARVGIFVDPLLDDSNRDQGIPQSAAIVDGMLTLSIAAEIKALAIPLGLPITLEYTASIVLAQTLRTGSMKVNPYMAFDVLPADVTITPAIDR